MIGLGPRTNLQTFGPTRNLGLLDRPKFVKKNFAETTNLGLSDRPKGLVGPKFNRLVLGPRPITV